MRSAVPFLLAAISACTAARSGRFRDQPVVWRVDDTRPIAEPSEREFDSLGYYIDGYLVDPMRDVVDPPDRGPARNTNALDEVPDSTWFENRIGQRTLSPADIAAGPALHGPPVLPLTIVKAKRGGNPGFLVRDATGVRYLVKFDTKQNPEQQTGGDAIVSRLFWAIGYNVPSDHVIYFKRAELQVAPELAAALTADEIERTMADATRRGDEIRAIASAFLPGAPKGGWSDTGVRSDDDNDTVAHQHRRELRGMRVFAAWLGHTDMRPNNTVDLYAGDDGRKFLRHYLVDFGEALGGHQSEHGVKEIGFEYGLDLRAQALGLVTFGLWVRDWEDQRPTRWPAIGSFGAEHFDPKGWHERYPYTPFRYMDAADAYWGAKIVMRFDRAQLEAAVAEARFSDPAASAYLVDTLLARREKIGRAYLDGVTPFDDLRVEGTAVCGTDLGLAYGIATTGVLVARDGEGAVTEHPLDATGHGCIALATDGDYHLLRVRIRRDKRSTPAMELHYRATTPPRLLGVVR